MLTQKYFPHYESMGDKWRAQLLAAILTLAIPITVVLALAYALAGLSQSLDLGMILITLAFEGSVWLVWKRFGLHAASIFLVLGASMITSVIIFLSGGIASTVMVGQVFVVVKAALLTTTGVTIFVLAATTIFNFLLIGLAKTQFLSDLVLNDAPVLRFFIQTAVLAISAGTILYSKRIMEALTLNLANSEYRFRSLFEKTSDAVFITGMDLHLVEVNEQAARVLAYEPSELIGMPVRRLFPANEWGEVEKRFQAVNETASLVPATRRFLTKTGHEVMLETNLSLVHDVQGNPLHYQSTGRDVTQKVIDDQRIKSTLVQMTVKASTDSLTGLLNRETVLQQAEAEWERYVREQQPMSLMLVDMDGLKALNDSYGHQAGDQALNIVARSLERNKRPYDWAGRYGGDEFLIVLPGAGYIDTQSIARRMDIAIRRQRFRARNEELELSCSFGVASTEGHDPPLRHLNELINLTDVELYKAKQGTT